MFERLLSLLPPPEAPVELPPPGGWERVEQELTPLPGDYKWFIERYGTGSILGSYMAIYNPFSRNQYLNLVNEAEAVADSFRDLIALFPESYGQYPFFPPIGGFLPFGRNSDGTYFVWSTVGDPNDWTVAVYPRAPHPRAFDMGLVEWLVRLFSGEIRAYHLADDLLDGPINFIPLAQNDEPPG